MKKILNLNKYKLSLILLFCSILFGCKKILTEKPMTFLNEDATFSTQDGAVAATLGIYETLRDNSYYGQSFLVFLILNSDVALGRGSYSPVGTYQVDARNINRIGNIWTIIYVTINRANVVIENVPKMRDLDQKLKDQLVAEARFLRGLCYYNLVRLWGDVPLRLKPAESSKDFSLKRTPRNIAYDQIIEDLKFGEKNLPDSYGSSDIGRATKWAAKTLLADVYLTLERWVDAAAKAKEVIESGKYKLVQVRTSEDFQTKIFGPDIPTNSEDIFSLKYSVSQNNDPFVRFFHKPEAKYSDGGPYAILGNLNSFIGQGEWETENSRDLRRNDFLYSGHDTIFLDGTIKMLFRKFRGTPTNESNSTPILRYPEALLIFAEAESQAKGGPDPAAYEAVNKVRRRAYGKDIGQPNSEVDLPIGLTQVQFRDSVVMERAKEFLVEGKRWFDLLRTHRALSVIQSIGLPITKKNLLWPIPPTEIDNNDSLTQADQNPGW